MVVVVANKNDIHAMAVHNEVYSQGGQCSILDIGELCRGDSLYHSQRPNKSYLTTEQGRIKISGIKSLWYRRPYYSETDQNIYDREARLFTERKWRQTCEGLFHSLEKTLIVNRIGSVYDLSKTYQLFMAKKAGLTVPDTIVTNSHIDVKKFYAKHEGKIIHKALTATNDTFLTTKLFSKNDFKYLNRLYCCPTIFQELIEGDFDFRVTVINEKIYTARIATYENKGLIDSRIDLTLKYERFEFDDQMNKRILTLIKSLGLRFGTADFKLGKDGRLYFLEVNPQGQFIYVQLLTGMPLVKEMAKFLLSGAA